MQRHSFFQQYSFIRSGKSWKKKRERERTQVEVFLVAQERKNMQIIWTEIVNKLRNGVSIWFYGSMFGMLSVCHMKTKATCSHYSVDSQNFVYNSSSDRDATHYRVHIECTEYIHEQQTHTQFEAKHIQSMEHNRRNSIYPHARTSCHWHLSLNNTRSLSCYLNVRNVYIQSE